MEQFLEIVEALNAVYRGRNGLNEEKEILIYFNNLNDLEYEKVRYAISQCMKKEEYYPSVATIRKYATYSKFNDWTIEWDRYNKKTPLWELEKPTQYVVKILTKSYIDNMVEAERIGQIQKEFKQLYDKFCTEQSTLDDGRFLYTKPVQRIEVEEEPTAPIYYNGWTDDDEEEVNTKIDRQNVQNVIQ